MNIGLMTVAEWLYSCNKKGEKSGRCGKDEGNICVYATVTLILIIKIIIIKKKESAKS